MTARVQVTDDGQVLVRTGKVELGQGLHLALAQIVADELGVPLARIRMLPVDTESSPDEGVTSGSLSVQDAGAALRRACAELQLDALRAQGAVGQSPQRPGLADVFAGQPHFIHDLELDGLLHGRVLHPPKWDAQLLACDTAAAAALPGVLTVLRDGQLLGVVANTPAQADAALAALGASAQWDVPAWPPEEAADLQALPATTRVVAEHNDSVDASVPIEPATGITLRARYTKPWICHASIGPSCALARWDGDGHLQVWSHSQGIFNLRRDLALAFGIEPAAARVIHVAGAGCYGHNGADDVAFDAAWLARAVHGHPVRVTWSRADELTQSPQGPAMVIELAAQCDAQGQVQHWQHELWSPGHSRRPGRSATPALLGAWQVASPHAPPPSIDMPLAVGGGAERNAVPGYQLPAWQVRCHSVATRRRSSALRSLGAFGNVFATESFVDEIAHAQGVDALAWRRQHLQHDGRALAVLDAAATRAGWPGTGPQAWAQVRGVADTGLGLATARYKGSGAWCAVVAEVQAGERLRVRRLTIAVDVGQAVHPDGVANQIEGGAIQATSWALLEQARPAHEGWPDYPILRCSDVPQVDVIIMPSTAPSLGAGEASLGPTAAAIANALFNALGVRVRDLPLSPDHIIAAMETPPR